MSRSRTTPIYTQEPVGHRSYPPHHLVRETDMGRKKACVEQIAMAQHPFPGHL